MRTRNATNGSHFLLDSVQNLPLRPHHNLFNLQKMEDIYRNAQGKADEPHRHDYYTLLLVEQGEGKHFMDYVAYDFSTNQVHFVSPGQIHQVALTAEPKGWVITFSQDFLVKNNISESFITNLNLFQNFGENPPLDVDEQTFKKVLHVVRDMEECLPEELFYHHQALGALLQLFLIYCNNSLELNPIQLDELDSGICLLRNFKNLLNLRFSDWHKVAKYASELNISPKHLSHTVKKYTGKTAKDFIQDRILLEAKRLLLHSDLSVKQIAYEVGFEEPLNFSGFFKKNTGQSASDFREISCG